MTPNQHEDLDRDMKHEARDYDEWKPVNRVNNQYRDQMILDFLLKRASWIIGIAGILCFVSLAVYWGLKWMK